MPWTYSITNGMILRLVAAVGFYIYHRTNLDGYPNHVGVYGQCIK
jgi:hypothetical protein